MTKKKAQQKYTNPHAFSKSHSQQQKPPQVGGTKIFDNEYWLERLYIVPGKKSYAHRIDSKIYSMILYSSNITDKLLYKSPSPKHHQINIFSESIPKSIRMKIFKWMFI